MKSQGTTFLIGAVIGIALGLDVAAWALSSFWKDAAPLIQAGAALIQASVVFVGTLVGGIWTWQLFIRKRLGYPRASVDLSISHLRIVEDKSRLVHVATSITNTGEALLRPDHAELRLRQVRPIPESLVGLAANDIDVVHQGQSEIEWPVLANRAWPGNEPGLEIEPGESDTLHADFMIRDSVSAVEFYFFVSNSVKKKNSMGWTCTRLYVFEKGSMEVTKMAQEEGSPKSRLNEQQRQQQQQAAQQQQQQHKQGDQSKKK